MRTLGVIGGLGPEATADFFQKVLSVTDAKSDQDHIPIVIHNDPRIPDRNKALAGEGPSSEPALIAIAKRLEQAGADFLAMPCNTAHAYAEVIQGAVNIPFLNMIDETVDHIVASYPHISCIGLLMGNGCRLANVYERPLQKCHLTPVHLSEEMQDNCMDLIYMVKSGRADNNGLRQQAINLLDELQASGAELIVLACSEFPLLLADCDYELPVIDSTNVLATACVAYARR